MKFNEDSRVKIPALLHFTRLGYHYLSLKGATWDESCNIFPSVFKTSVQQINPGVSPEDIERTLQETCLLLDNEDLGNAANASRPFTLLGTTCSSGARK